MDREFDPKIDGWSFENWGEGNWPVKGSFCNGCALPTGHADACEFTWDLFRETYLLINPTHDCLEAPPDCAFYEIFKKCASQGNCGGLSLLALALYKYGGYMGFCSEASFYTGSKPSDASASSKKRRPDIPELHKAMNLLQARQFSAKGILNFVELFNSNNINDANAAYKKVSECLANGDFAVLSLANDAIGEAAHTVIPYKLDDHPTGFPSGTKAMHIWDSNFPYDVNQSHYAGNDKLLVIRSSFDWTYAPNPSDPNCTVYSGAGGGWCFAVPMSLVLTKSRQPMALEIAAEALITLFATAPGATISQISDEEGHRLYKTSADIHKSRLDFETDPNKRLKGVARWPWYGFAKGQELPGELYFMLRHPNDTSPIITMISGTNCRIIERIGKNVIEILTSSKKRAKDTFKTSGAISDAVSIEIKSTGKKRDISINHTLLSDKKGEWRRYTLEKMRLPEKTKMTLTVEKEMSALVVSTEEEKVQFELNIQQRRLGKVMMKKSGKILTVPNKDLRIAPKKWETLSKSKLIQETLERR